MDVLVTPTEKVDDDIPQDRAEYLRKQKETVWIHRLATLQPLGMNYIARDTQVRTGAR